MIKEKTRNPEIEPCPKHDDDDTEIPKPVEKTKTERRYITLAELHPRLFSRYASPSEVYVSMAVDDRGEHVTSDEICRR